MSDSYYDEETPSEKVHRLSFRLETKNQVENTLKELLEIDVPFYVYEGAEIMKYLEPFLVGKQLARELRNKIIRSECSHKLGDSLKPKLDKEGYEKLLAKEAESSDDDEEHEDVSEDDNEEQEEEEDDDNEEEEDNVRSEPPPVLKRSYYSKNVQATNDDLEIPFKSKRTNTKVYAGTVKTPVEPSERDILLNLIREKKNVGDVSYNCIKELISDLNSEDLRLFFRSNPQFKTHRDEQFKLLFIKDIGRMRENESKSWEEIYEDCQRQIKEKRDLEFNARIQNYKNKHFHSGREQKNSNKKAILVDPLSNNISSQSNRFKSNFPRTTSYSNRTNTISRPRSSGTVPGASRSSFKKVEVVPVKPASERTLEEKRRDLINNMRNVREPTRKTNSTAPLMNSYMIQTNRNKFNKK